MTELSDADRGVLMEILLASGADEEWHTSWIEAHPEAAYAMLATARRLITAEILAASGQPPIARLAAENAWMRGALRLCEIKFEVIRRLTIKRRWLPDLAENGRDVARAALGEKP